MVGSIRTAVSGARTVTNEAAFLVTNVLVSAGVGYLLGLLGSVAPASAGLTVIAVAGFVYVVGFVLTARIAVSPWPPQVPRTWRNEHRPVGAAVRYGTVLGLAYATPIRAGSLVMLGAASVVLASPIVSALLFGLVGLLRALPAAILPVLPRFADWGPDALRSMTRKRPFINLLDILIIATTLGVAASSLLT